ncbi:MAG: hypothetical protein GC208_10400 [Alphaproteobacteria bacterium]|nr:hypothetical protein [Alphaproteobacteria bacterium]
MNLEQVLAKQERELRSLTAEQVAALRPVLDRARRETRQALNNRFAKEKQSDWTMARVTTTTRVLDDAYSRVSEGVQQQLGRGADVAKMTAVKHEEAALRAAGVLEEVQPLRLDETALLLEENSLLVERHGRLANAAARRSVQNLKGFLAVETLKGSTTQEVIDRLTEKGGLMEGQEYEARRLVNTEFYNTRNELQMRLLHRRREEGLDPKKRLLNPLDAHTAPDTLAIIAFKANLVRELDEPFWDPMNGKFFQRPPNRPNDRAVLVAYYGAKEEEEAIARTEAKAQGLANRFPDSHAAITKPSPPPPKEERPKPKEADSAPIPSVEQPPRSPEIDEKALVEAEREVLPLEAERAVWLDPQGDVIAREDADPSDPYHITSTLPDSLKLDATVVHNHPTSQAGLSRQDIRFLIHNELREIRAVYRLPESIPGVEYAVSILNIGAALRDAPSGSARGAFVADLALRASERFREVVNSEAERRRYAFMGISMGWGESQVRERLWVHALVLVAKEFGLSYRTEYRRRR